MRWALIGLLLLHGLVHFMGFAKAFGYAELPQLTRPISREWGSCGREFTMTDVANNVR